MHHKNQQMKNKVVTIDSFSPQHELKQNTGNDFDTFIVLTLDLVFLPEFWYYCNTTMLNSLCFAQQSMLPGKQAARQGCEIQNLNNGHTSHAKRLNEFS